jgi:hypothetical protein
MTPSKNLLDRHTLWPKVHIGGRTVRGHPYGFLMKTAESGFKFTFKGKHLGVRLCFSPYSFNLRVLTTLA